MCPGIHLAERNQWRIVSKLIWAFEIKETVDPKTGKTVTLDPEDYSNGLLHCPNPYKVIFKPRSQAHIATIIREMENSAKDLAPFE